MKILFIAPSAYLLGGVQDWLYMVVCGLRSRGHQVTVGVPDNYFHNAKRFNRYFKNINAVSFSNSSGTPEGRIRALTDFLLLNRADIILGVNIGDLYEAFTRLGQTLDQTKIVLTLHAIEANYFEDLKKFSFLLDAVITTNRLAQKMVLKMSADYSYRTFYAPYGIIPSKLDMDRKEVNDKTLRIAWVGRVEDKQKRVFDLYNLLLELDSSNEEYVISIAGDGPCLEELKTRLNDWETRGRVIFHGFMGREGMQEIYCSNNILLITSQWETGPIVAWEAMAAGLAVVSSEYIGSLSEEALIHEKTALLYKTGDMKKAANQIIRLKDLTLRHRIRIEGRTMVLKRYTEKQSVTEWENAMGSILELEERSRTQQLVRTDKHPAGKIELILGVDWGERLRHVFPFKRRVGDAGSEWPHSIHGKIDQTELLNYATNIERSTN